MPMKRQPVAINFLKYPTEYQLVIKPVERVGEYCVAEADSGGEYVDGRNTGAPHYAGLVP